MNTVKKLLTFLIFALIFTACAQSKAPEDTTKGMAETPVMTSPTNPDGNAEVVQYALDLSNFKFEPNLIEMEAGSTIKVKLVNIGGFHDFVIDELGVKSSRLQEGQEEIINITAPAGSAGQEYAFYCSVGKHRAMGMEGVLKIREAL